jgi:hypothetical protein
MISLFGSTPFDLIFLYAACFLRFTAAALPIFLAVYQGLSVGFIAVNHMHNRYFRVSRSTTT